MYLSLKLADKENHIIATSVMSISQKNVSKITPRIILTHLVKRWNGNKSSAHPITNALKTAELVVLKVYYFELK